MFRLFTTLLPLYLFLSLEALPPSSVLYLHLSSLHLSVGPAAAAACTTIATIAASLLAYSARIHTSIGSSVLYFDQPHTNLPTLNPPLVLPLGQNVNRPLACLASVAFSPSLE